MRKLVRVPSRQRAHQRDHSFLQDKVRVRQHVLRGLAQEGVAEPTILDAYCGEGLLWRLAYRRSSKYLGLDTRQFDDARRTIVCDNRRYLRMADLDPFDVFDLDAYGSPAECLAILCHRLQWTHRRVVGIVLTDGTGLNAKMNGMNRALLAYLGVAVHAGAQVQWSARQALLQMLILTAARQAGALPEQMVHVQPGGNGPGSQITYIGYLLRRQAA